MAPNDENNTISVAEVGGKRIPLLGMIAPHNMESYPSRFISAAHKPIGYGGIAAVYKEWDRDFDRIVAVKKVYRSECTDPVIEGSVQERLRREFEELSSMDSENILKVFDYGENIENGISVPFVVMEYIQGESGRIVDVHNYSNDVLFDFWEGIADAIDYCHSRKRYQGDVKPSNFMMDTRRLKSHGVVRGVLCDFGRIMRFNESSRFRIWITPGFAPQTTMERNRWVKEDEHWAFAGSILSTIVKSLPYGKPANAGNLNKDLLDMRTMERVLDPRNLIRMSSIPELVVRFGEQACDEADLFFALFLNDREVMGLKSCRMIVNRLREILD